MIAYKLDTIREPEYKHLQDTVYLPYFIGDRVIISPTSGPLRDFYNYQLEKYQHADNVVHRSFWRNEAQKTLRLLYFKREEKQVDISYAKIIREGFKDPKFIRAWKGEICATAPCPVEQLYLHFKFEKCTRKYICNLFNVIDYLFGLSKYGKNTQEFLLLKMLLDWLYDLKLPDRFYKACIPNHELMALRQNDDIVPGTSEKQLIKQFPDLFH